MQGQGIDGPADFCLAVVDVAQGGVVPGPAAGNVLRLVDMALSSSCRSSIHSLMASLAVMALSFFLKFRLEFQPPSPPPIAARRCEI